MITKATFVLVLLVLALVCFICAAIGITSPKVNFMACGAALFTGAFLLIQIG